MSPVAGKRVLGSARDAPFNEVSMSFSKYTMLVAAAVSAALFPTDAISFGQDRQPTQPEERVPPGDGPQRFRTGPPGFALREALDKDRDGKISTDEIQAAAASLKTLDRNSNGKLEADEIGWPPQFGGGGGRGRGGRGGGFGPGGFGGRGGAPPVDFSKRIMSRDADRDGKVSSDELPRSMRSVLKLADQNNDASIDETEAEKFAQTYGAIGRSLAPTPERRAPNPEP
jgi:hypothetical protein